MAAAERFTGTLVGDQGARLVVRDAEHQPAAAPPPVPVPPPSQRPTLAVWHYGWPPMAPVEGWPAAVFAAVDVVHAAMAQSARKGSGQLTTPPGLNAREVRKLREAGKAVHVGIGGASDGGITVTNATQVAELVTSMRQLRDAYGYSGATIDLEPSGSSWTHTPMVDACRALVADGFTVEICSALYQPWTERWGNVARELGPLLTRWSVMAYDYPQAEDSRHRATTLGKVGMMLGYTTADRVHVAFRPRPAAGASGTSPLPVLLDAAAAVRAAHPKVGFAVWEDRTDQSLGWPTVKGLRALLDAA